MEFNPERTQKLLSPKNEIHKAALARKSNVSIKHLFKVLSLRLHLRPWLPLIDDLVEPSLQGCQRDVAGQDRDLWFLVQDRDRDRDVQDRDRDVFRDLFKGRRLPVQFTHLYSNN